MGPKGVREEQQCEPGDKEDIHAAALPSYGKYARMQLILHGTQLRTNQQQRHRKSLGSTLVSSNLGFPSMVQTSKQQRPKNPPLTLNSELQKYTVHGERAPIWRLPRVHVH